MIAENRVGRRIVLYSVCLARNELSGIGCKPVSHPNWTLAQHSCLMTIKNNSHL